MSTDNETQNVLYKPNDNFLRTMNAGRYTLDIEAVSCDEMYVDLSDVLRATRISVMDFVSFVREEIKTKTGCTCSAGVGANRLQARMATKKAKPNGQFELQQDEVEEYFLNIEISDLPGVGYSITKKLNQLNWKTCADLREIPLTRIQQEVGTKFGMTLHQLVFGHIRKSVSTEVNYGIRFTQQSELETFLKQLCTEVHNRFNNDLNNCFRRKFKRVSPLTRINFI